MDKQKAFLVVINEQLGIRNPVEIVGVVFVSPFGKEARACYHVRFDSGTEDFIPMSGVSGIKIISEEEVRSGRIPKTVG